MFKSLAEEQLPLLRLWFLGNRCVCVSVCVSVCVIGEKRIQGVFLAFDGQLNAWLVKTAEQNVPRAKGRGEVTHAHNSQGEQSLGGRAVQGKTR